MSQITCYNNMALSGFNFSNSNNAVYPDNQNDPEFYQEEIKNSFLYSFVNAYFTHISDNETTQTFAVKERDEDETVKYIIYRKKIHKDSLVSLAEDAYDAKLNESPMEYVGTFSALGPNGLDDFGTMSGFAYKYYALPSGDSNFIILTEKQQGNRVSVPIILDYDAWLLVDIEFDENGGLYRINKNDPVFLVQNNVSFGQVDNNVKVIEYETLGRFNRMVKTAQKHDSGSLQFLFGEFKYDQNNNYVLYKDVNLLNQFKECIANNKVKLLKSPSGEMWIVSIYNQSSREIDYKSSQYPETFTVNWKEVADASKAMFARW